MSVCRHELGEGVQPPPQVPNHRPQQFQPCVTHVTYHQLSALLDPVKIRCQNRQTLWWADAMDWIIK